MSPLLDAATSTDPSPQDSPAVCVSATVDIEEVEDALDDLDIKVDGYAAAFAAPSPVPTTQSELFFLRVCFSLNRQIIF